MSRRTTLKIYSGTALLFMALAFVMTPRLNFFSQDSSSLGTYAVSDQKASSLKPHHEVLIRTHKLRPPYQIKIEKSKGPDPLETGSSFELTAHIDSDRNFGTLAYEWRLPRGIRLAKGTPRTGTIRNIIANSPTQLVGQFENLQPNNQKIHLRIWVPSSHEKMVQSAQFNTLEQEQIDAGKRELIQRQKEYIFENPEKIRKFK
jgi:hypothetical protein